MIFGLCILTCTYCKFLGPQWIFEFCNYYRTQNVDQLFVLCILLHPLNTRTWKVPTAIECFNLCTRIHALIECVCISTHQQRRTPICILQGTCFQSHCYCLCFLVKYLCLNVYVRIVSNYYRAEQWGTIVWMLQVTRSLPVACAGLLKTKMPPNQIVVSIMLHKRRCQFGIEYVLLYCCILYWMHITEETDHYHATSTVWLR